MEKDGNSRKDGEVFLFTHPLFKDKQTKKYSMLSYFCTLLIIKRIGKALFYSSNNGDSLSQTLAANNISLR